MQISFLIKKQADTFLMYSSDYDDVRGVVLENPTSEKILENSDYAGRSTILDDGRVVYVGCDPDDSNYRPVVTCLSRGTTNTDWSYTIEGKAIGYFTDMCVLNNGNLVVFWVDYDDELPYFYIFTPDGTPVVTNGNAQTDGGATTASYDYWSFVTPLEDGGFACSWYDEDDEIMYMSTWDADGTNKATQQWVNTTDTGQSQCEIIQMPSGGGGSVAGYIMTIDTGNGYANFYDPDDLTTSDESHSIGAPDANVPARVAKAPLWNDQVIIIWDDAGAVYGTILDDTGSSPSPSYFNQLIIDTLIPYDLIALPNGNFIVGVYELEGPEVGNNYYIIDGDLNTVSGPHVGFAGTLAGNPQINNHGCAI